MTNIAASTAITNSNLSLGNVENFATVISNSQVTNGEIKYTVSFTFSNGTVGQITKL